MRIEIKSPSDVVAFDVLSTKDGESLTWKNTPGRVKFVMMMRVERVNQDGVFVYPFAGEQIENFLTWEFVYAKLDLIK